VRRLGLGHLLEAVRRESARRGPRAQRLAQRATIQPDGITASGTTISPGFVSATSGAPQNWHRTEIVSLSVTAPQPRQVNTFTATAVTGLRGRTANSANECSRTRAPVGASGV
jgi:hypothetical protein